MMRKRKVVFALALCLFIKVGGALAAPVNTAFNSDLLYACVIDAYNEANGTDYDVTHNLTDDELKTIKKLECQGMIIASNSNFQIDDAKGIEKLTELTRLDLSNNAIESIDLSKNIALEDLEISNTNLKSLDVSKNVNLIYLRVKNNELTSLDISKNVALANLDVSGNNLTSFDVNEDINLGLLYAYDNKLTSLNVKNNSNISILYIYNNELTTLHLNENTEFNALVLNNNKFMDSIKMNVGDTVNLSDYITLPDTYDVTYEIDDEEIATINDGKIKGLKEGNTTATLTISGSNICKGDNCENKDVAVFKSNINISKDARENKSDSDEIPESPKTGVYSISISTLLVTLVIGYIVLNKKNKINKI